MIPIKLNILVAAMLGLLSQGNSVDRTRRSLLCYKCITLSCSEGLTNPSEDCMSIKYFVTQEIAKFYNMEEAYTELPGCPKPAGAGGEWDDLRLGPPSSVPCVGIQGRPTCALGRFKVSTLDTASKTNSSVFGTVMGCASMALLEKISESRKKAQACSLETSESFAFNSRKHFLELEHCAQLTDLCYNHDYCINPRYSGIRTFRGSGSWMEEGSLSLQAIVICILVGLGILITLLTFLGIKYDS